MPEFDSIQQLIRHGIQNYPANSLLLTGDGSITYRDLDEISTLYIQKLNGSLPSGTSLIGIIGNNPVHVYATLLSGNAYLPIDSRWPVAHIVSIIQDAKPKALLCPTPEIADTLFSTFNGKLVSIDENTVLIVFDEHSKVSIDTVYVLYTSGSTGKPKGVVHTHKSAITFLNWCAGEFTLNEPAHCISIAPFQFDLSVFDLFFPFYSGGSLLIPPTDSISSTRWMAEAIATKEINIIYSTPSFYQLLLQTGRIEKFQYDKVQYILSAGERLIYSLAQKMKEVFPNAQLYNLYGPTETNVCTYHKIEKINGQGDVPIGKCCTYSKSVINNDGSLLIAGNSLMQGYLRGHKPFEIIGNDAYYHTGDIVELNNEGNFMFKGRKDKMLKRNGYRIEPGQVEECLMKLENAGDVKVAGYYKSDGKARLIAFMAGGHEYSSLQCKIHCLNYLPDYMVPDKFVVLKEWPLNFNHKTDLQELINQYD